MSFRVDRGRLGAARIDHNGNLVVTGALTRTGVFTYKHTDGPATHVLRHPDDVYAPEAVASFVQVPVTDEHPDEGRITPGNVSRHIVGNVGDTITRDGTLMKATLVVRKADTIAKVMGDHSKPKRALSCGYTADVIPDVGVYNGIPYTHRQTNIRGNHVALVATGRAGPDARLLLDAEDGVMESEGPWLYDELVIDEHDDATKDKISKKISKLVKEGKPQDQAVAIAHDMARDGKLDSEDDVQNINVGGGRVKLYKDGISIGTGDNAFKLDKMELDVPDEAVEAVEKVFAQRDLIVDELRDTRTKLAESQGKIDALEEQKKDWEDPAKLDQRATEISDAKRVAIFAGFKEDELAGKYPPEIKRMVVGKRWPDLKLDGLDDGYITGRFGVVVDEAIAQAGSLEKMRLLGDVANQHRTDDPSGQNGGGVDDDELSYRQQGEKRMDGMHLKSAKELEEAGLGKA